ncbi:MMPL family transporter [Thermococcus sp. Bubb.Bath]|uniref:MMPL family transporter n=1 Tax=Thermococcus sp. Bubb.Bath TaxID=1638242 RepID=UPI00143B6219|nr:MMPL family transporter [Thermococcus sp. Bubb.Bath]NJF24652.1 multidrug RND transporter [Thermococcus sp. Bubb.Bath]
MAWNDWIVKHAKLIIALWVVTIILATPLAMKLSNVTNYSMSQFLPKHVESVEVQNDMTKYFPSFAQNNNMTYMIITNINVSSPEAKEAYERFKVEASPYGSNFTSYYDAVDLLHNESYGIALNLTKTTANLTEILYNSAVNASDAYGITLTQIENLSNQVKVLNGTVPELARAYLSLETNLTVLYNQSLALKMTLNQTDTAYVELHQNLTKASEQLKSLNSTIAGLNVGLYNLSDSYAKTYLGTIGTYDALVQSGAYEMGLNNKTAQGIAIQLGVPVEFVYAVYNATYPAYSTYGATSITDGFLANVTKGIALSRINEPMQKNLAEAYSVAFYHGVTTFDKEMGCNYTLIHLGKDAAKPVSEIANKSLENLPFVIEEAGGSFEVPGFGKVPAQTLAYIANVSIGLGRNPSSLEVENATIGVAKVPMKGSPLLEMPNAEGILRTLLVYGPTGELETNLLASALREKLPTEQKALAEPIAKTVVSFDTNATGVLAKNPEMLKKATVSLLAQLANGRGVELPESVISQVYDSNGNVTAIAKELLIQKTAERVGSEKAAEIIVNEVLKNPEELVKGTGVKEAVREIITSLAGNAPVDIGKVVNELYAGESTGEIAYGLFEKGVNEKLANVTAPEDVKKTLKGIMLAVARNYPISDSQIQALVKERTAGLVGKLVGKINLGVPLHVNTTQLVDVAFRFRDDPGKITREDVKPVEEQVYPSVYGLAKDYISMLKSPNNTTMLVSMVPKGAGVTNAEEQSRIPYENTLKAKEVLLKEMRKHFPEAEAYISGTPVQTYELVHYGEEDDSRTTKFSFIGALIVLFIILGTALLATLLPFTGVATAILTALGILYLLAKGNVINVGSWARTITMTTSLGLGIDYSTYYLHRFKEHLAEGYDHNRAASEALRKTKDAILASASVDVVAFASFMLAWEFPIFKEMGIIVPTAVLVVFAASLTLIPAITVLIGDRPAFWWPRHVGHVKESDIHKESRIARWSVKHAKAVLLIFLLLLAPAVYTFANFNGTHDIKLFLPKDSETYHFLEISQSKLGADVMGATYVLVKFNHNVTNSDLSTINGVVRNIERIDGVKYVYTITQPYGKSVNASLSQLQAIGGGRYLSSSGNMVLIEVVSRYQSTTPQAHKIVMSIRSLLKGYESSGKIAKGMVGGGAALDIDLSNLINDIFWHRMLPVALVLMFLLLIPTLKGIPAVISTMATVGTGVLLSIAVSTWLFQRLFGQEIMWFLPLLVFIVLMGVGIDYNSFYLVKARDEFERRSPKDALIVAAGTMDLVVIGLATVLGTTYGALMTSSMWGMREMGFALASGVLITATLAVYFLGPAMMSLFGEKAWWPLFKNHSRSEAAGKKEK